MAWAAPHQGGLRQPQALPIVATAPHHTPPPFPPHFPVPVLAAPWGVPKHHHGLGYSQQQQRGGGVEQRRVERTPIRDGADGGLRALWWGRRMETAVSGGCV